MIRIILAQEQAILSPAGEHAVGFYGALGHKIVDEHSNIGLVAPENEGVASLHAAGGIDAGDESLGGGLFVSGGAVDLSGEVEVATGLGLEAGMELGGEGEIVFDGVGGAEDFRIFAANDGADHFVLALEGEAGGEAVDVDFVGGDALGFKEYLVRGFVGEFNDLILDARAVAGADSFDDAGIHGRLVDVRPDDLAGALGGAGDVTRELATETREDGGGGEV